MVKWKICWFYIDVSIFFFTMFDVLTCSVGRSTHGKHGGLTGGFWGSKIEAHVWLKEMLMEWTKWIVQITIVHIYNYQL